MSNTTRVLPAPSLTGPGSVRTTAKTERSTTALRDVNVSVVRPNDLIAHQGYTVLLTDLHGRISEGTEGFFLHQTRFLSKFSVTIDDAEPKFISANVVDHHFITSYRLAPTPPASRPARSAPKPGARPAKSCKRGSSFRSMPLRAGAFTSTSSPPTMP